MVADGLLSKFRHFWEGFGSNPVLKNTQINLQSYFHTFSNIIVRFWFLLIFEIIKSSSAFQFCTRILGYCGGSS